MKLYYPGKRHIAYGHTFVEIPKESAAAMFETGVEIWGETTICMRIHGFDPVGFNKAEDCASTITDMDGWRWFVVAE